MLNEIQNSFPPELKTLLQEYNISEDSVGGSKTSVFHCKNENNPSYYLKVATNENRMNLKLESTILHWLRERIPVPEVIFYSNDKNQEFLLLSEVQGIPSHFLNGEDQKEKVVTLLAQGLLLIHSVEINECPFDNSLPFQIDYVKGRIKNGLVNEQDFDQIRKGRTVYSLYKELMDKRPQSEDLVFTHGDYCLPNIIINNNNKLSGFIDFGLAGISDRYLDIGICVRSITFNFGEKWIPVFLKKYGLKEIDTEKIHFYQLLDEFY